MARNNGTKTGAVVSEDSLTESPVEVTPPSMPPTPPEMSQETAVAADQPQEEVAPTVAMSLEADLAEAGRAVLHEHFQKLQKAAPVAHEGSDTEGVHDMRVATRRLRASLQILEETVYQPKVTHRYRRQLRGLAESLGRVRDNDVFLEHLEHYRATLSEEGQAGLEPLRQGILDRQARNRKAMLKTLDSAKTRKMLHRLEEFVTTPGAGLLRPTGDGNESHPTLVRHFVTSTVWRRYEEVLAYETRVGPITPVAVLHRLRVASKRLRYSLEFFQDALPSAVKTLHKQLVDLQDQLGAMHDHQVAIELCESFLKINPTDTALQAYQDQRATDLEKLRGDFLPHWQAVIAPAYKAKLAGTLIGKSNAV